MTTFAQVCHNGHIMNTSPNPEYIRDNNYCPDCGEEGIIQCQDCCDQKIVISDDNVTQEDVSRHDLDLFCRNCGNGYPWADENGIITRNGTFVDDTYAEDVFYSNTIREINRCYRIGANGAVLVLYRKLLENIIIDVLRGHFGTTDMDMYFSTRKSQHHRFSILIDNLSTNKEDLQQYSDGLTHDFIQKIYEFKYDGDAQAHSIKISESDSEIEERAENATYVANILLQAREEIRIANN